MNARFRAFAAAAAAAVVAAGCGEDRSDAGAAEGAGSTQVTVKTFMFDPDPVEVRAGQTVKWTNADSAVHTVTSGTRRRPDGVIDERLAESGGTAQHTFTEPGTYRYHCSLHSGSGMEGKVVVR